MASGLPPSALPPRVTSHAHEVLGERLALTHRWRQFTRAHVVSESLRVAIEPLALLAPRDLRRPLGRRPPRLLRLRCLPLGGPALRAGHHLLLLPPPCGAVLPAPPPARSSPETRRHQHVGRRSRRRSREHGRGRVSRGLAHEVEGTASRGWPRISSRGFSLRRTNSFVTARSRSSLPARFALTRTTSRRSSFVMPERRLLGDSVLPSGPRGSLGAGGLGGGQPLPGDLRSWNSEKERMQLRRQQLRDAAWIHI